ncbi:MAG: cysteine--tRNA ligase [Candidatus Micrarchaeota archaeon]|nr:cysteine--tRNA ligase [Candidatus Micrarchaeota archaeon]
MRIFDSFAAEEREFAPATGNEVLMYVCGLTPYDRMHVGHIRTYIFFDVVRRYLEHKGYTVNYLQNVTDVEDKVFNRAAELGMHPLRLAEDNMRVALSEMDRLGIKRPSRIEKVSDNIPAIIRLIQRLIENGYAYESGGDVYFSVEKFSAYGQLSRQDTSALKVGARIAPGEHKRNPLDFTLWKASNEKEAVYDSPWGRGRPGWHIECSALATTYLGETIDIHGGGRDLVFPHHENEIAQSESATGKKFVRFWMHTGYLTINGEKMSKSLGNFITADELLRKYDPPVIRWYLLTRHYRSPIDFSFEFFDEAKKHFDKMVATLETARVAALRTSGSDDALDIEVQAYKDGFYTAMDRDFDTPNALVCINEIVREINKRITDSGCSGQSLLNAVDTVVGLLGVLGIEVTLKGDEKYIKALAPICAKHSIKCEGLFEAVESLLNARDELRRAKRYAEADEVREALRSAGIIVEDFGGMSIWRRA